MIVEKPALATRETSALASKFLPMPRDHSQTGETLVLRVLDETRHQGKLRGAVVLGGAEISRQIGLGGARAGANRRMPRRSARHWQKQCSRMGETLAICQHISTSRCSIRKSLDGDQDLRRREHLHGCPRSLRCHLERLIARDDFGGGEGQYFTVDVKFHIVWQRPRLGPSGEYECNAGRRC